MAQCSCAYRLAHFKFCGSLGGAAKSRGGKAPGKGQKAYEEDVLVGFLGLGVPREDLPAEHRDQLHCQPGFVADAELQVCSFLPSRARSCPFGRPSPMVAGDAAASRHRVHRAGEEHRVEGDDAADQQAAGQVPQAASRSRRELQHARLQQPDAFSAVGAQLDVSGVPAGRSGSGALRHRCASWDPARCMPHRLDVHTRALCFSAGVPSPADVRC